tara:strand:- start:320 stop:832 length:513 start_codon:yes stop_codon:yes gene_type:complete
VAVYLISLIRQIGILHERTQPFKSRKSDQPLVQLKPNDLGLRYLDSKSFEPLGDIILLFAGTRCPVCETLHADYFSDGAEYERQDRYVVFSGEHPERVKDYSVLHNLPLERVLIAGDLYVRIGVTQTPTMVFLRRSEEKLHLEKAVYVSGVSSLREHITNLVIRAAGSDL